MNNIEKYIIWDFDNVLFKNPENDYSDQHLTLDRITDKNDLPIIFDFDNINILLTGRGCFQAEKIDSLLRKKGYIFNLLHFFHKKRDEYPNYNPSIQFIDYWNDYITFKKNVLDFYGKYFPNVVVIDDQNDILDLCKNLNVKTIRFDINEKE